MVDDRRPPPFTAIVLSHQRSMPIAAFMIDRYFELWPDHPFDFRLPDVSGARPIVERHAGRVHTVPTAEGEGRGRLRAAVLGLVDGIPDDEWVYWCIDDKYPVRIDVGGMQRLATAVRDVSDPRVSTLTPVKVWAPEEVDHHDHTDRMRVGGIGFHRRITWARIWQHQFVRAGLLRELMEPMPELLEFARPMDGINARRAWPDHRTAWSVDRSLVVLGESTLDGELTRNLARVMARRGPLPDGYPVGDAVRFWGDTRARFVVRRLWEKRPLRAR